MTISVVTPSFNQLDWLRLCIASVRDQVEPPSVERSEIGIPSCGVGSDRLADGQTAVRDGREGKESSQRSENPSPNSHLPYPISVLLSDTPLRVEHIIQDAGSPGIEDFAREVGADFYRDGKLISHSIFRIPSYSLTIYCESDNGMYDAINRGWSKSQGQILCYLNCDEQYLPSTMQKVASFFTLNTTVDLIFADAIIIDQHGRPLSYRRIVLPSRLHTRTVHLGIMTCAMFFRRKLFEAGLSFDTKWRVIGDVDWIARALDKKVKMTCLREVLSVFTLTGDNLGANADGLAEAAKWRSEASPLARFVSPAVKLAFFATKAFGGAYFKNSLSISLFTPDSPLRRKIIQINNLTWKWPTLQ